MKEAGQEAIGSLPLFGLTPCRDCSFHPLDTLKESVKGIVTVALILLFSVYARAMNDFTYALR